MASDESARRCWSVAAAVAQDLQVPVAVAALRTSGLFVLFTGRHPADTDGDLRRQIRLPRRRRVSLTLCTRMLEKLRRREFVALLVSRKLAEL